MIPPFETATASYEAWLGKFMKINAGDLNLKHQHMAESPFMFLRATFYRWMQLWNETCEDAAKKAPVVLAIGDLHIENFGTWRDLDGRLIWGINDFDETYRLPYTIDLVRLAASARLAIKLKDFRADPDDAVDAILSGYEAGVRAGGRAFVLEEHNNWLRDLALNELRDPATFWKRLADLPPARSSELGPAKRVITRSLPTTGLKTKFALRIAGLGSLGRPRLIALSEWGGGWICREAKSLAPSACLWAQGRAGGPVWIDSLVKRAIRVTDPCFRVDGKWIVRRLAPHCSKISLGDLPRKRDELELLQAMGFETANIHLGSIAARELRADLGKKRIKQIRRAVDRMVDMTLTDYKEWRKARR